MMHLLFFFLYFLFPFWHRVRKRGLNYLANFKKPFLSTKFFLRLSVVAPENLNYSNMSLFFVHFIDYVQIVKSYSVDTFFMFIYRMYRMRIQLKYFLNKFSDLFEALVEVKLAHRYYSFQFLFTLLPKCDFKAAFLFAIL